MKYCNRCVMPDTRPGIYFSAEGVCGPCLNAEKKKVTDWENRWARLNELCHQYKDTTANYNCIITVSGGKDSHFQVKTIKQDMGMNPLLLNVSNFSWTEAGRRNFENISEAFGCDILSLNLNRKAAKIMLREALERYGSPTWYWDRAVYVWPLQMAIKLKIPLIFYGENISYEYGGPESAETPSAKDQINNNVAKEIPLNLWEKLTEIPLSAFNPLMVPEKSELDKINPQYLSYYVPWSGSYNYELAKRYGFKDLSGEWTRQGYIENYDQIDSPGYLVHPWMKYPKYGHARATDVACYWIREGKLTREEAVDKVTECDHKLDPRALDDFCAFTGYTTRQFWEIVDRFYNPKLFKKERELWKPLFRVGEGII